MKFSSIVFSRNDNSMQGQNPTVHGNDMGPRPLREAVKPQTCVSNSSLILKSGRSFASRSNPPIITRTCLCLGLGTVFARRRWQFITEETNRNKKKTDRWQDSNVRKETAGDLHAALTQTGSKHILRVWRGVSVKHNRPKDKLSSNLSLVLCVSQLWLRIKIQIVLFHPRPLEGCVIQKLLTLHGSCIAKILTLKPHSPNLPTFNRNFIWFHNQPTFSWWTQLLHLPPNRLWQEFHLTLRCTVASHGAVHVANVAK